MILSWILSSVGLLFGLWLLTRSADWFVDGAVALAHRIRMPELIVGFVIVGFGTSLPEMLVSVLAAAQGMPLLSLGNAYGSNITNVLLILGVSMLIAPIAIHRVALKRDIPFLFAALIALVVMSLDGCFSRIDGILLLGSFLLYLTYQIVLARRSAKADADEPAAEELTLGRATLLTVGGLLALLAASQILVLSAKWIATTVAGLAGLSPEATQLIVGLTVVATGTSLPELMASVAAMRKGQPDIALGNVVGSNCFNLCIVAGLALIIHPVDVAGMPPALTGRDLYVMMGSILLVWIPGLIVWARLARKGSHAPVTLGRGLGICFVIGWVCYTLWAMLFTN